MFRGRRGRAANRPGDPHMLRSTYIGTAVRALSRVLSLPHAPLLIVLLAVAALCAPAPAQQCARSWIASPNGVYDGPTSDPPVLAMTAWTPPGTATEVLVVGGN